MRTKQQDPSDRLKLLIALHVPPQMLSIAQQAFCVKRYTFLKQGGD